jgi:lantibiotic modifying enzyme
MVDGDLSPLLHGESRRRAMAAVDTIAGRLRASSALDATLAGGAAGVALFFSYLAQCTGDEDAARTAVRFVEAAIDGSDGADAGLFEGRTGVAWVVAHLDGRLLDLGNEDPNVSMDAAVLTLLDDPQLERHDLVSGLAGLGVFALERLPRPPARLALERVVTHLGRLAEVDGHGVRWFTPPYLLPPEPRRLAPAGHWDLGMAHGAAGVVALLAHARAAIPLPAPEDDLLDGAVTWLLDQRLPVGSASRYGAWLATGQAPVPARTAWCYGDPGVAAALLAAGRRQEALEVARAAARRPTEQTGVVDGGLCHGAGGLLHVFNRLRQATGDGVLADAARHWFEAALVLPTREPGFLEGAAGLGLALLAAATDVEPAWDRILLLSGPVGEWA